MNDEKRRFSRVFFDVRARLEVNDRVLDVGRLANLSIGGCLLEIDADLNAGDDCTLKLLLSRMAPPVTIGGKILRTGEGEASIIFTVIYTENLFHLQNIVRYNAEDPDAIEEEISKRPGLK